MQGDGLPLRSLTRSVTRFFSWWRDELWGLVPASGRRLVTGARPDVVLAEVEGGFCVLADQGQCRQPATPETLTRAQAIFQLAEMARTRTPAVAGIRVPVGRCYSRRMEIPKAARADARQILNLDLERVTPLRLREVHTAHVEEGDAAGGKVRVRQLVAKREAVDPLVADVRSAGFDVAFVDCWEKEPSIGLPLNFLDPGVAAKGGGANRLITLPRALAALAAILILTSIILTITRYETALAEIRTETAKMRERAASVRQALDRADATVGDLVRLQQAKATRISSLEIIEEVSRLLPDTVWLSEFRFEGDALDISGLAKAGAALPALFAQSSIFADAALTAPLTLDPREDKERFSLRVRIKQPATAQEATVKAPKG